MNMSADVDLKTIKTMLAIEKEGSFAKAAQSLYISQPALTQYIKRIESKLSCPLYYRDNGRCIPTDAANLLLTEGKELLTQFEAMMQSLNGVIERRKSVILMGWATGYTVQYLDSILSKDSQLRQLNVQVTEDTVELLLQMLLQRKLHFLLIPALYYHPDLIYSTIRHEEFYLAVPKDHIANQLIAENGDGAYADLAQLRNMHFITVTANPYVQFINPLFKSAGYTPSIIFKCKNWNSSHALVENGLGLAIVPYWFAETKHRSVMYYRLRSDAPTYRTLACVYHKDQVMKPEFLSFIQVIKEIFGDENAHLPFDQTVLKHLL